MSGERQALAVLEEEYEKVLEHFHTAEVERFDEIVQSPEFKLAMAKENLDKAREAMVGEDRNFQNARYYIDRGMMFVGQAKETQTGGQQ